MIKSTSEVQNKHDTGYRICDIKFRKEGINKNWKILYCTEIEKAVENVLVY